MGVFKLLHRMVLILKKAVINIVLYIFVCMYIHICTCTLHIHTVEELTIVFFNLISALSDN